MIKSLSKKDSPENGSAVMFDIELEQIRLVSSSRVRTTNKPIELKTQAEVKAEAAVVATATESTTNEDNKPISPMTKATLEAQAANQLVADDVLVKEQELAELVRKRQED